MKYKIIFILALILLNLPVTTFAVEIAPRISDREIVEKLARLEVGQESLRSEMKSLRSEMKSDQENLRSEMNHRFESLANQYERIWNLIMVLIAGIMGLIGFIVWDRKTATRPLEKKIIELESNLTRDLELRHEKGSLLTRLLQALRELSENDPKLSEVLRSFSLL